MFKLSFCQYFKLIEALEPEKRHNMHLLVKYFNRLDKHSTWNADHSIKLAQLARDFVNSSYGKKLAIDSNNIAAAALMHDVGKVDVNRKILHKPGKLTPDEKKVVDTHTFNANDLLDKITGDRGRISKLVANYHHTHTATIDQMVQNNEITVADSIIIKVITVLDALEALLAVRPYKQAWDIHDISKLLLTADNFDHNVVQQVLAWHKNTYGELYHTDSDEVKKYVRTTTQVVRPLGNED